MPKVPDVLKPAEIAKNKAVLTKLQTKIPNFAMKLGGLAADITNSDHFIDAKMLFNDQKPGSLDPVNFAAKRKQIQAQANSVAMDLLKRIQAMENGLDGAIKDKALAKDKKAVAYVKQLSAALVTCRATVRSLERELDNVDDLYKAQLKKSPNVQAVQFSLQNAVNQKKALEQALGAAEQAGTIDAAVNRLTAGGGNSVARKFSTAVLGAWLGTISTQFPKLSKEVYKGNAQAEFMNDTWIDVAANHADRLDREIRTLMTDTRSDEKKAVELFCREYRSQAAKADQLVKSMQVLWGRLQKAGA